MNTTNKRYEEPDREIGCYPSNHGHVNMNPNIRIRSAWRDTLGFFKRPKPKKCPYPPTLPIEPDISEY